MNAISSNRFETAPRTEIVKSTYSIYVNEDLLSSAKLPVVLFAPIYRQVKHRYKHSSGCGVVTTNTTQIQIFIQADKIL